MCTSLYKFHLKYMYTDTTATNIRICRWKLQMLKYMYEAKFLILKLLKVLYKDALIKLNYRVRFFLCPREQIERLKAQSSSPFRISKYWLFTGNIQFIKQKNNIHSKQSWSLTFKLYALTYWDWLKILLKKPQNKQLEATNQLLVFKHLIHCNSSHSLVLRVNNILKKTLTLLSLFKSYWVLIQNFYMCRYYDIKYLSYN